jgi:putative DNA primase/helicase
MAMSDAVEFDSIPGSLARLGQWLVWRFESKPGDKKPRKVPYYTTGARRTGEQGSDADRAALVDLATAQAAVEHGAGRWTGVGFAFLPGDGLIGVDLDGMVDAAGVMSARGASIIEACASYTEWSPSGKGVHIICSGETTTFKSNEVGVEVFCGRQFFTFTGRRYPGTPDTVNAISAPTLGRLKATVDSGKKRAADGAPSTAPAPELAGRAKVESALAFVSPDCGYDDWIHLGMAIHAELGADAFDVFDAWSAKSSKYAGSAQCLAHWKSFKAGGGLSGATIFKLAMDAGWRPPHPPRSSSPVQRSATTQPAQPAGGRGASPDVDVPRAGWRERLIMGKDAPKDCRENVIYVLGDHPEWAGSLAIDTFAKKIVCRKPTPLGHQPGDEWTPDDETSLGLWLTEQANFSVRSLETISQAVRHAALVHQVHPVREYFNSLEWDGVRRVDAWVVGYLSCDDAPYSRMVGMFFLLNMVRRIFEPGCVMRSVPVFEGAQNKGKSRALWTLTNPWYSDTMMRIGDKDSYQALQGVMCYEVSEMDSFTRSEASAVKAFISSTEDNFRAPYERAPTKHKRQTSFAATTNAAEYLKDWTGNTRFWPLAIGNRVDLDGLAAVRDQLWAETVSLYHAGERAYPTPEQERTIFKAEQDKRVIVHPWNEIVAEYVGGLTGAVTTREVMRDALKIDLSRINPQGSEAQRVGQILHGLGYAKHRLSAGTREWVWKREEVVETAAEGVPI